MKLSWLGLEKSPKLPVKLIAGLLVLIITLSVLLWGRYWLTNWLKSSSYTQLRHVVVTGKTRYLDSRHLQQALADKVLGQSIVDVDVDKLQQAVIELPWVKNATVKAVWPDKLTVGIIEQVPVALWNNLSLIHI